MKRDFCEAPYLTTLTPNRWILHTPTRFCTLGSIDPIIEAHEKSRGVIDLHEALGCLDRRPEEKARWDSMTADEEEKLQLLIEDASDKSKCEVPAIYMCELSWTTLSLPENDSHVTFNLRCQ